MPLGCGWISVRLRRQLLGAAREEDHAVFLDRGDRRIDARRRGRPRRPRRRARLPAFSASACVASFCGVAQRQIFLHRRPLTRDGGTNADPRVRVGDRGQLEELIDAAAAFLIAAFQLDADARAGHVVFGIEESRIARAGVQRLEPLRREIPSVSSSTVTSARLVFVFIASSM